MLQANPFSIFLMLWLLLTSCTSSPSSQVIRVDGSNGVRPLIEILVKGFQEKYPNIQFEIGNGMNSRDRINALAAGQIDLAMASHGIDEKKLEAQDIQIHKFAQMAIVFGVNLSVTVDSITDQQVCDIYAGNVRNWQALNGPDLLIAPLTRPDDEVDTEVILAKNPCFVTIQLDKNVQSYAESGDMAKALASTTGAIGMTTMVRVAKNKGQIRPLVLNGIEPSSQNIQSGSYPLTRNSYLLTKGEPNAAIQQFLDFIKSEAGSSLILSSSAVPTL